MQVGDVMRWQRLRDLAPLGEALTRLIGSGFAGSRSTGLTIVISLAGSSSRAS